MVNCKCVYAETVSPFEMGWHGQPACAGWLPADRNGWGRTLGNRHWLAKRTLPSIPLGWQPSGTGRLARATPNYNRRETFRSPLLT